MNKIIKKINKTKIPITIMVLMIFVVSFSLNTNLFAKSNSLVTEASNESELKTNLEELKKDSLEESVVRSDDFSVHYLADTYATLKKDDYYASTQVYFITENKNNYPVFCLDPEILFSTLKSAENISKETDDTFSKLPKEIQTNIISIMNKSIELYDEYQSNIYLGAGQLLIWEQLGYEVNDVSSNLNQAYNELKSVITAVSNNDKRKKSIINIIPIVSFKASEIDDQVYGVDNSSMSTSDSSTADVSSEVDASTNQILYDTSGQDMIGQGSASDGINSSNDEDTNQVSYDEKPVIIIDDKIVVTPGTKVDKQYLIDNANLTITDAEDGDLIDSKQTKINFENLDVNTPGTYAVTITTKDSKDQSALADIDIIVSNPPQINVDEAITVPRGTVIDLDYLKANNNLTVTDVEDGNLINSEKTKIDLEGYDNQKAGMYEISIRTADSDGLQAEKETNVTVIDEFPTIYVDSRVIVPIGTDVNKQYLIDNANLFASDEEDGDLTDEVMVDFSHLNVDEVGEYTISLKVSDTSGNESTTNTIVEVKDSSPELTIDETITIYVDEISEVTLEFLIDRMHLSAIDVKDGDITDKVIIDSTDFLNEVGEYTVNVSVTNSDGLSSSKSAQIIVVENTAPVITVDSEVIVDLRQEIDLKFLEDNANLVVYDAEDGNLIDSEKTELNLSAYNKNDFGEYLVPISTEDSQGQTATNTTTVKIINEAPSLELIDSIDVPNGTNVTPKYLLENGYVISAIDKEDGDISESLELECPEDFDSSIVGTYSCTGIITDSGELIDSDIIIINILPVNNPPVINVSDITIEVGTEVNQQYYIDNDLIEVIDIEDGDMTTSSSVVMDFGVFDNEHVGNYMVTTTATDSGGEVSTKESIIQVVDTTVSDVPKIIVDSLIIVDDTLKGSIDKQYLIDNANLTFVGNDGLEYLSTNANVSAEQPCLDCSYGGDAYVTIDVQSSSGESAEQAIVEIIYDSAPIIDIDDIEMVETATPIEVTPINLINLLPNESVTISDDRDEMNELILNSVISSDTSSNFVGSTAGKYIYEYTLYDSFGHETKDQFTITVLDIPEIFGNSVKSISYDEQEEFNSYFNKLTSKASYDANPDAYKLGLYVEDSDEDDLYWEDVSNITVTSEEYDTDSITNEPGEYEITYTVNDSGSASVNSQVLQSEPFTLNLIVKNDTDLSLDLEPIKKTQNTQKYNVEYVSDGYDYVDSSLEVVDNNGLTIESISGGGIIPQVTDVSYPSEYTGISTCSELASNIESNPNGKYILVSDIDCSETDISELQTNVLFTGTLEGNNHVINGITIDYTQGTCVEATKCVVVGGLFSRTHNSTIKNLGINDLDMNIQVDPNVSPAMMSTDAIKIGGLIGESDGGVIDNVYIQGNINILGTDSATRYVSSQLSGFGGLIGAEYSTNTSGTSSLSITDVYTNVNIVGSTMNTGGVIGNIKKINVGNGNIIFDNVLATGDLDVNFIDENLTSTMGGLIGYLSVADGVSINNSLYNGNLTGYKTIASANTYNYASHTIGYNSGTSVDYLNTYYFDNEIAIAGETIPDTNVSNTVALNISQIRDEETYNFLDENWYIPNTVSESNSPLLLNKLVTFEYDLKGELDLYNSEFEIYINLNQQADLPLSDEINLISYLTITDGSENITLNSKDDSSGSTSYVAVQNSVWDYIDNLKI